MNNSRDRSFGLKITVRSSGDGWKWLLQSGDETVASGRGKTQLGARAAAKSVKDALIKRSAK